jgi:hypothetical protein
MIYFLNTTLQKLNLLLGIRVSSEAVPYKKRKCQSLDSKGSFIHTVNFKYQQDTKIREIALNNYTETT